MDAVTVHTPLPEVVYPDEIAKGALIIIAGTPYIVDSVQPMNDPWTQRPSLAVDTVRGRIFYLILQCEGCDERTAMKYAAKMSDMEWVEVRYHGEYHWLCPDCASPIMELVR